ncbi:hypothetical protein K402DRAFT_390932 [Aulographum hederae CBS 113979]|uniref:Uncharacterized protein n=1 Tax=Aulographum hederae CBS 113979 TaxID=1176131 RepID=A0A6G1H8G8_9PEZI|nr:hypothetical protein K402DRAFT_390932 [Aulographum hederae CBS 113979]
MSSPACLPPALMHSMNAALPTPDPSPESSPESEESILPRLDHLGLLPPGPLTYFSYAFAGLPAPASATPVPPPTLAPPTPPTSLAAPAAPTPPTSLAAPAALPTSLAAPAAPVCPPFPARRDSVLILRYRRGNSAFGRLPAASPSTADQPAEPCDPLLCAALLAKARKMPVERHPGVKAELERRRRGEPPQEIDYGPEADSMRYRERRRGLQKDSEIVPEMKIAVDEKGPYVVIPEVEPYCPYPRPVEGEDWEEYYGLRERWRYFEFPEKGDEREGTGKGEEVDPFDDSFREGGMTAEERMGVLAVERKREREEREEREERILAEAIALPVPGGDHDGADFIEEMSAEEEQDMLEGLGL